jgi:hypothetical protein
MSEYDYLLHFDKAKMVALSESIKKELVAEGLTANLWSMEPWKLAFDVRSAMSDFASVIHKIYQRPEVTTVSMGVEPGTRLVMIHISLSERWFIAEEKKNGKASKRHPEDAGGDLA